MSTNHPNRGRRSPAANPTVEEIRALADSEQVTQARIAELTESSLRSAQEWVSLTERRRMHPGLWALLRARIALARGDESAALEVLRERV